MNITAPMLCTVTDGEEVARLDPLGADAFFRVLPLLNSHHLLTTIIECTRSFLPDSRAMDAMNQQEALAVLRDLGMMASSLRRAGMEPVDQVDGLERVLLLCAAKAGTVPRDTVFTYGPYNPDGARQRRFTDLPEEAIFIASFTSGMARLDQAVESLLRIKGTSLTDPSFVDQLEYSLQCFEHMTRAIVTVKRYIPARVFTYGLRPYFDPYRVGCETYTAPGGAQMPVLLLDQILWGSDYLHPLYQNYLAASIAYLPQKYRLQSQTLIGQSSLLSYAEQDAPRCSSSSQGKASLFALRKYLNRIVAFRSAHFAVAKENFLLRTSNDLGSGGYRPDLLEFLLAVSQEVSQRVSRLIANN